MHISAVSPTQEELDTMSFEFSEGDYCIGDLCYLFEGEEWSQLLRVSVEKDDGDFIMSASVDGMDILALGTEHGDGIYEDNYGNSYGVDSGTLGIVPTELVDPDLDTLTHFTFSQPFTVSKDGPIIRFGGVSIDTDF